MQMYTMGEEFSDEEEADNFVIFVALEDPTSFEQALEEEKGRTTMKVELQAIEKHNTLELCKLHGSAKKI